MTRSQEHLVHCGFMGNGAVPWALMLSHPLSHELLLCAQVAPVGRRSAMEFSHPVGACPVGPQLKTQQELTMRQQAPWHGCWKEGMN